VIDRIYQALLPYIDIFFMAILGLMGGAVRVCGNKRIKGWRSVVSSLMTSAMAGGITGAILHSTISDPIYLGAVCSMGGFFGQQTLEIIAALIHRRISVSVSSTDRDL
jgi:hypothetical protein